MRFRFIVKVMSQPEKKRRPSWVTGQSLISFTAVPRGGDKLCGRDAFATAAAGGNKGYRIYALRFLASI
jgi:hypothetical protein